MQELLAPENVVFCDKDWRKFGSKSSLEHLITITTDIQRDYLVDSSNASVAQKMSWASRRKTTRVEDIAYSLMGLFDVNIPLLYGEGDKAFTRLQHEIVKISNDESIFAWTDNELEESGLFARSPKAFSNSGKVVEIPYGDQLYVLRAPYAVTNRGLGIEIFRREESIDRIFVNDLLPVITLNCRKVSGSLLAIEIRGLYGADFVRSAPGQLTLLRTLNNLKYTRLVYIRPSSVLSSTWDSFFIDTSWLSWQGFTISRRYCWRLERDVEDWPQDARCFRVPPMERRCGIATLLHGDYHCDGQFVGVILGAYPYHRGVDLCAPSSIEDFEKVLSKRKIQYERGTRLLSDVGSEVCELMKDCWVSATLAIRRGPSGERHYSVKFKLGYGVTATTTGSNTDSTNTSKDSRPAANVARHRWNPLIRDEWSIYR